MNAAGIVHAACEIVSEQLHTDTETIFARTRRPESTRARELVLWLLVTTTQWGLSETSRAFAKAGGWELDWSSIRTALNRAEKRWSHQERLDLARELAARVGRAN